MDGRDDLPRHDEIQPAQRAVEAASIAAALALIGVHAARLVPAFDGPVLLLPLLVLAGIAFADLVSGVVHWLGDTWGSESLPWIGPRLVRPFRVHHVNPRDFLRRDLLDTNGDVAAVIAVVLALALLLPVEGAAGSAFGVFLVAAALAALPTNQVHQWAHREDPPRAVAWLQRRGVLLGRAAHARHHRAPQRESYCIATGWLNGPTNQLRFFETLERVVTRITGAEPRHDDLRFQQASRDPRSQPRAPSEARTGR